jgi:hypothetical protein
MYIFDSQIQNDTSFLTVKLRREAWSSSGVKLLLWTGIVHCLDRRGSQSLKCSTPFYPNNTAMAIAVVICEYSDLQSVLPTTAAPVIKVSWSEQKYVIELFHWGTIRNFSPIS